MRQALYLDTARLGLMSPTAQRMYHGLGRFIAETPDSLNTEDFWRHGFAALSSGDQRRLSELCGWSGLAGLKDSLRLFVVGNGDTPVLIAGRSQSLMKLAARCLFQHCRHVLTTDLSWLPYQQLLEDEARRTGHGVTQVPVRERLFRRQISLNDVSDELAQTARRHRVDGLFLPAVDNLGIRLPIADIVAAIRQRTDLQFVVTDAAQALGHVPLAADLQASDLVLAGSHKWLGGYLPLGLAFLSNRRSCDGVIATCQRMQDNEEIDDPLLDFLLRLESDTLRQHTETVNLSPLLTCCGALESFQAPDQQVDVTLRHQLANAHEVRIQSESLGWQPLLAASDQHTGIVSLICETPNLQSLPAETLRLCLRQLGITATTYPGGIVRLSMPRTRFASGDIAVIRTALQAVSRRPRSDDDSFDFIQADGVAGTIIELRRASRFVSGDALGMFEGAAAEEVAGDAGGSESVATDASGDAGQSGTAFDHPQHVDSVHPSDAERLLA